jgi:oligopeptide/dipeptide ABC transporter ATP-binding protein
MGVVGETGAGKTLTMMSLLGLLPTGLRATGVLTLRDDRQFDLSFPKVMKSIRGAEIGIVLQNPAGMFDPLIKIKHQLVEGMLLRKQATRATALRRAEELLADLGFRDPDAVLELFPHQLSGGMAQRAAIAMALMPRPSVIIADEPTSALDAHIRAEALELLRRVANHERAAVLLVSHDLGLVSNFCDDVTVMYAGRVVERGTTKEVLEHPAHPYTQALLDCSAALDAEPRRRLSIIPGVPPTPGAWPRGCVFEPRCQLAYSRCRDEAPLLRVVEARSAACHLAFAEAQRK